MAIKDKLRILYHGVRKYLWACKYSKFNTNKALDLNNSKKIVVVSHSAIYGGAPVLAYHIVRQLKEIGFTVAVVILEYGDMTEEYCKDNTCYFCLNNLSIKRVAEKLRIDGFDKCICNSALSGYAAKIFSTSGFEVISLVHELPGVLEAMNGKNKAQAAINNSKAIVFPSSVVKEAFLNNISNDNNIKSYIRPQGIYLVPDKHLDKTAARAFIEKEYNIKLKSKVVLNVASVSSRKGFDIFLEMANKCSDIQFIWVGIKQSPYYFKCIENHGGAIPDNLLEIGYVNDANRLFSIYHAANIFALTSREEPMGTVVLEAFSAGLPVIAFNNRGGFVDVIKNGINGFLIDKLDSNDMLDGIEYYFSKDSAYIERMCDNCTECANSMSFEKYVKYLVDLF